MYTVFIKKKYTKSAFLPAPDPELASRPQLCVSPSSWDRLFIINLPASLESKVQ
jgi:hypothetical protein